MNVLLTGSAGQLGTAIIYNKPDWVNLISTDKQNLDLSNEKECRKVIDFYKPEWIINAGAYTNVELAEKNQEEAFNVNSLATEYLSHSIFDSQTKLLHISTDYVFDGENCIPYKPYDRPNPINIYGESKLAGEKNIQNILGNKNKAIILRSSWIISPYGNNFLTKFINLLKSQKEIKVVTDQISCPTSAITLAKMCWQILIKEKQIYYLNKEDVPIFHCSDSGKASWYDLGKAIMEISFEKGIIKNKKSILPIKSSEYHSLAIRPQFSLLCCKESFEKIDFKVNNWKDELYKNILKMIN